MIAPGLSSSHKYSFVFFGCEAKECGPASSPGCVARTIVRHFAVGPCKITQTKTVRRINVSHQKTELPSGGHTSIHVPTGFPGGAEWKRSRIFYLTPPVNDAPIPVISEANTCVEAQAFINRWQRSYNLGFHSAYVESINGLPPTQTLRASPWGCQRFSITEQSDFRLQILGRNTSACPLLPFRGGAFYDAFA